MIRVKATGFPQFFAAHAVLRAAGVAVVASGGNEMRVPDDTDLDVLRAVAVTGAVVHADLSEREPDPAEPGGTTDSAPPPARKPRKTTTRRTSTKE